MANEMQMNKLYGKLSPTEFQRWFESKSTWDGLDWKYFYKQAGGKLPKKQKKTEGEGE
jgi:hypothetical protein